MQYDMQGGYEQGITEEVNEFNGARELYHLHGDGNWTREMSGWIGRRIHPRQ